MAGFIKFFFVFFLAEFTISTFASSLVILLVSYSEFEFWLTSSIQMSSVMLIQILIRNLLGNYFFSWMLMNHMKKISTVFMALLNSVSVVGVYFILSSIWYIRGDEFGANDLIITYQIGIPMLIGIVGSSFIMAMFIKKMRYKI